ncbi:MAG: hypothetical protein RL701_560 [Pseudomonadota bacterium]|jgi:hypothetical protein
MSVEKVVPRCAVHPARNAIRTCERCGNYACAACAPGSSAAGLCASCDELAGTARYHAVPVWRFVLFSLLSLGSYEVYWMYKNWQQIKRADQSAIHPFLRAIVGGFMYFSLITDLNLHGITRERQASPLSSALLGTGYLLSSSLWRLPDPWWLIGSLNVLFLVPAVQRIWRFSSESVRTQAARWSMRHTIASVLGVLLWGFLLFGMTLDE